MGSDGVIDLGNLNSATGVILEGEGGQGGWSVSAAGDVNGDGVDDMIIGTESADRSYLVFGVGCPKTSLASSTSSTSGVSSGISSSGVSSSGQSLQAMPQHLMGLSPLHPVLTDVEASESSVVAESMEPSTDSSDLPEASVTPPTTSSSVPPVTSSASRTVGDSWLSWLSRGPASLAVAGLRYVADSISSLTALPRTTTTPSPSGSPVSPKSTLGVSDRADSLLDSVVTASQNLLSYPTQDALMLLQIPVAKLGRYRDRERPLTTAENQALQDYQQQLTALQHQFAPHHAALVKANPELAAEVQHLLTTMQSELTPALRSGHGSPLFSRSYRSPDGVFRKTRRHHHRLGRFKA